MSPFDPYATFAPEDCRLAKGPLNDLSSVGNPCCNASIASVTKITRQRFVGKRLRRVGEPVTRENVVNFAVLVWSSANSRPQSIYGVVDHANPGRGQLPPLHGAGHWADTKMVIPEDRFKDAKAAKESIATFGCYLLGGELTIMITEGSAPPNQSIAVWGIK